MKTNGIILTARGLSVWYGAFRALRDIELEIKRNTTTALIGPSGCGKSTLLRSFNRMNDLIPEFLWDLRWAAPIAHWRHRRLGGDLRQSDFRGFHEPRQILWPGPRRVGVESPLDLLGRTHRRGGGRRSPLRVGL